MSPRFWVLVGGPLSVAAGLILAAFAYVAIAVIGGNWTEGGYCSPEGTIGRYETSPPKTVGYLDEGFGGFPPRQSCSVYLLAATDDNPLPSVEESLSREPPPHHLLAQGSYPGGGERLWIVGLLLLPPAIWALCVIATVLRRRRTAGPREPASLE